MIKKIITLALFVLAVAVLASCGSDNYAVTGDLSDTTAEILQGAPTPDPTALFPNDIEKNINVSFDAHTVGENNISGLHGDFSVLCEQTVVSRQIVDKTKFDYNGSLAELVKTLEDKYAEVSYYFYTDADNSFESISSLPEDQNIMVAASTVVEGNSAYVAVAPIEPTVWFDLSMITAKSGTLLTLEFYCDRELSVYADIGRREGGSDILYRSNAFSPEYIVENGLYRYIVNISSPYIDEGVYYLSIRSTDGKTLTSVPINIEGDDTDSRFKMLLEGSWDKITDENYIFELGNMYKTLFPRLAARFGYENELVVTFVADPTFSGDAYSVGNTIVISTDYVNSTSDSINTFARELAKISLDLADLSSDWLVESLSTYAAFRYYNWAQADKTKLVLYSVDGNAAEPDYKPYASLEWVYAYIDFKYPTLSDANGEVTLGIIDGLLDAVRSGRLRSDAEPKNPSSELSMLISELTNGSLSSFDDMRSDFMSSLQKYVSTNGKKGWCFDGFCDYPDNFLTENIDGVDDPIYLTQSGLSDLDE